MLTSLCARTLDLTWRIVARVIFNQYLFSIYVLSYVIAANSAAAGGAGWGKILMGTAAGWMVGGKFHSRRLEKKLNAKFKADQKALYQQYYNDVYALQQQNAELMTALEQYAGRRA